MVNSELKRELFCQQLDLKQAIFNSFWGNYLFIISTNIIILWELNETQRFLKSWTFHNYEIFQLMLRIIRYLKHQDFKTSRFHKTFWDFPRFLNTFGRDTGCDPTLNCREIVVRIKIWSRGQHVNTFTEYQSRQVLTVLTIET